MWKLLEGERSEWIRRARGSRCKPHVVDDGLFSDLEIGFWSKLHVQSAIYVAEGDVDPQCERTSLAGSESDATSLTCQRVTSYANLGETVEGQGEDGKMIDSHGRRRRRRRRMMMHFDRHGP